MSDQLNSSPEVVSTYFWSRQREGVSQEELLNDLQRIVYANYHKMQRQLPWRDTYDPYKIWVSEIMLQQTQAERVIPKYEAFLAAFPTVQALTEAPVNELLRLWQGLGYNRRALALQRGAQKVVQDYEGIVPISVEHLQSLPGIGPYTASAIAAFAFNQPVTFIETNIRRVFIHFFFKDQENISDKMLIPLIGQAIDQENPREWYYALMDYGVILAKSYPNANRRSRHYLKQSPLQGSNRQLRGNILKTLVAHATLSVADLQERLQVEKERLLTCLSQLEKEGFISTEPEAISLKSK